MQAVILSIGDELVLGQNVDTNSAYLSAELAGMGITTRYHQTVADDLPTLTEAIGQASGAADLVLITGGLGPTPDDLTRQALAGAMGRPLIEDAQALQEIAAFFHQRGRPMSATNAVQALHPQGTEIITNTCGTAPGIAATLDDARIFIMPGPPREMKTMFNDAVRPAITATPTGDGDGSPAPARVILSRALHSFGSGESTVAQTLGELMDRSRNPKIGTTVSASIVTVRIRCETGDIDTARSEIDRDAAAVHDRLGPIIYGEGDQTLQEVLGQLLLEQDKTFATAESCTGGLVGKMLTDVAGSSAYYLGGWVTYTNEMKIAKLGVDATLVAQHGAVSAPVAKAMAAGARAQSGADLAIGITGIAGPGGGTADKPVGTVWIALAPADSEPQAMCFRFAGDRTTIRDRAAKSALQMARFHLLDVPLKTIQFGKVEGEGTEARRHGGTKGGN